MRVAENQIRGDRPFLLLSILLPFSLSPSRPHLPFGISTLLPPCPISYFLSSARYASPFLPSLQPRNRLSVSLSRPHSPFKNRSLTPFSARRYPSPHPLQWYIPKSYRACSRADRSRNRRSTSPTTPRALWSRNGLPMRRQQSTSASIRVGRTGMLANLPRSRSNGDVAFIVRGLPPGSLCQV